jgi:hypothetical protein
MKGDDRMGDFLTEVFGKIILELFAPVIAAIVAIILPFQVLFNSLSITGIFWLDVTISCIAFIIGIGSVIYLFKRYIIK